MSTPYTSIISICDTVSGMEHNQPIKGTLHYKTTRTFINPFSPTQEVMTETSAATRTGTFNISNTFVNYKKPHSRYWQTLCETSDIIAYESI